MVNPCSVTVVITTGEDDRQVVNLYEELYRDKLIDMEITKPSEQAFKAILKPDQVGGCILMFTTPVGRQEYENLAFLKEAGLVPGCRGLLLSNDPLKAAKLVSKCLEEGILEKMSECSMARVDEQTVSGKGVELFWLKVRELVGI